MAISHLTKKCSQKVYDEANRFSAKLPRSAFVHFMVIFEKLSEKSTISGAALNIRDRRQASHTVVGRRAVTGHGFKA